MFGLLSIVAISLMFAEGSDDGAAFNWAYFSSSIPDHNEQDRTVKPLPTTSCNTCHAAAADKNRVFTQHYPVLRDTDRAGETVTGGRRDVLIKPDGE